MENITPARALSALALYESAVALAATGTYIAWEDISQRLRDEAAPLTGCQSRKRLDRAFDCDTRALTRRTATAFHREECRRAEQDRAVVRAAFRRQLEAAPDFVPGGAL